MNRMHLITALGTAVLTFGSALSGIAQAQAVPAPGTVDLLTTPPQLTTTVAPNIVVTFDDSGSMMATSMPDSIENQFAQNYYYSVRTNLIYFDPTKEYPPPLRADGTSFPDARYTAAWRDGLCANAPGSYCYSSANTKNLSTQFYTHFGKRTNSGDSANANAGTEISTTVRGGSSGKYNGGFYFNCPTVGSNTGCTRVYVNDADAATKQKFANWYSYYRTRNLLSRTALTRAFGSITGDVRAAWQTINSDYSSPYSIASPALAGRAIDKLTGTWRSDFYNWLYNRNTTGSTPNRRAMIQAGKFFERSLTSDTMNPYWEPDAVTGVGGRSLSCRKNFHMMVTDGYWNDTGNASLMPVTPADYFNGQTAGSLPDGTAFSISDDESRVIWNVRGAVEDLSMANIAYHYWAKDLQPGLANNVTPYIPDKSTGITGSIPFDPNAAPPANDPLNNKEIYFNPANDPASWQHLSQFMITLGVAGTLSFPADLIRLRMGQTTSAGSVGWPRPTNNSPSGVDDTWHAAVNSRGAYFSANNPAELVQHLTDVLATILAQTTSSTPAAVSIPIMTGGNSGYQGGYDSSSWAGNLRRRDLSANGDFGDAQWDAGCILTGGQCADPIPSGPLPTARDPNSRIIFTSDGAGDGRPFRWASLLPAQQSALNANGSERVNHIRGNRSYEIAPATPLLRSRSSVLGAIVNGEPAYVSSPRSGYYDIFPPGSPEEVAASADEDDSYAGYQNAQRSRAPMVYAGSNDGMLHAIDADSGAERWAYIPNLLIANGRLKGTTERTAGLVPGVDSPAREADVFIGDKSGNNKKWRTILLGSLRLGGRGVYALDVTNPNPGSDSAVSGPNKVALWEFTSGSTPSAAGDPPCSEGATSCASLGYSYDSANVMRLRYQNKWVAVVSSGYFPQDKDVAANPADASEAAAARTSLLVIDLENGRLIREIRTSSAPQSQVSAAGFTTFGLSTPMVFDESSDQLDDVVYAGDLAGNLWRFDLSDANKDNWTVDLMFTTYGSGGAAAAGDQPIAYNPTALRDPGTRRPIIVVGTGKYLGKIDRTSSISEQAWYGVRDYGSASADYPIRVNQLVGQTITQSSDERTISTVSYDNPTGSVPATVPNIIMQDSSVVRAHGWRIRLNVSSEPGERADRRAFPLVSANVALLYGLIPKNDDPCDPGARYSVMAIDATNGGPLPPSGQVGGVGQSGTPPADPTIRRGGQRIIGDPGAGNPPPDVPPTLIIPGLSEDVMNSLPTDIVAPWHRGAWRILLEW